MASILRQKRAAVEVSLRRNRESTYTEPIMKKGEHKSAEEIADIKSYLSDFYRTIYKRSDECQTILREHPNTVAAHYANLVPKKMSYEDFWQRYFLRCDEKRIVAEWDRAASKAKKERAARVEEIQQSLQKSLRNIQDTFEVAATGGVNAPADNNHHDASPPQESFLPPILGPDAPDVTPVVPKPKKAEVAIAGKKADAVAKTNASSDRVSPAPKTAAGETTRENEPATEDTVILTPTQHTAPSEELPRETKSLQEMVAAANEVERNSPRTKQVRVVSPKVEPKVVSFWKNPDNDELSRSGSNPSDGDLSMPKLVKEGAAKGEAYSSVAREGNVHAEEAKKKTLQSRKSKVNDDKDRTTTVPHDLKRTGSKVADRDEDSAPDPKKQKIEESSVTQKDARQIGDESLLKVSPNFSNTSVMLLLVPALIGVLLAMLFNSDLACAAIKPGLELSDEDLSSEAPFWAPDEFKKEAFALSCPGRTRTSLDWTSMGSSGRGNVKSYRLTLRDLDALEGGDNRPLYDKRHLQSGTVSPMFISVITKKGIKEKINAPWAL